MAAGAAEFCSTNIAAAAVAICCVSVTRVSPAESTRRSQPGRVGMGSTHELGSCKGWSSLKGGLRSGSYQKSVEMRMRYDASRASTAAAW